MCWGLNQYGELGDGTYNDSPTPVNVSGLASGVSGVITGAKSPGGSAFSCALVTGGAVKCWGTSLVTLSSATPLSMSGFTTGVSKISAGDNHFCTVTADGRVKCMGSNQFSPLGDGQGYDGTAYAYGLAAGSILDVSAGREHTCALTSAGGVKCWGDNSYGQLGYGEARYITAPGPGLWTEHLPLSPVGKTLSLQCGFLVPFRRQKATNCCNSKSEI